MPAGEEDLRVLLEETLADCGVRRRLTVGGTAYYANGRPFAAARGDCLYLRLCGAEREEVASEAALAGLQDLVPDSLGLLPLPSSLYGDAGKISWLVVRSYEQALAISGAISMRN